MALDFFGTITITMAIVLTINAVISTLKVASPWRLLQAVILGSWIGLSIALASSGQYEGATAQTFPVIGVILVAPLITVAAAALLSPAARAAVLALPMPLLIGLNLVRVLGAFFLLLAATDRLGGPFPYSAGWGDIITGVFALPVAVLAARNATDHDWMIAAWNVFGLFDLVAAVALGLASAPGSPLQIFHEGAGSAAMQYLPWALVPTVIVPFFIIVHGIVFAQLRVRARARQRPAGQPKAEPA